MKKGSKLTRRLKVEIKVGMDGDIVIVELTGDLVASTADQLKAQVSGLLSKNFRFVLLEMSKIGFMDSSGLGACMAAHKSLADKGGMLVCARPSEAVDKIFRITRADKKLAVTKTKDDGTKALLSKIIETRQK